jgi:hypothetical protein
VIAPAVDRDRADAEPRARRPGGWPGRALAHGQEQADRWRVLALEPERDDAEQGAVRVDQGGAAEGRVLRRDEQARSSRYSSRRRSGGPRDCRGDPDGRAVAHTDDGDGLPGLTGPSGQVSRVRALAGGER